MFTLRESSRGYFSDFESAFSKWRLFINFFQVSFSYSFFSFFLVSSRFFCIIILNVVFIHTLLVIYVYTLLFCVLIVISPAATSAPGNNLYYVRTTLLLQFIRIFFCNIFYQEYLPRFGSWNTYKRRIHTFYRFQGQKLVSQ